MWKEKAKEKIGWLWYCFVILLCNIFSILLLRLHIYGRKNVPKEGAVLIVSNHQSLLDPIFCSIRARRQMYFLARDTLFKNKIFAGLISSVKAIPVRRGQADMGAMKAIIGKLKAGGVVCLFPEATRTHDGRISEFKPGFGLLCRRGNAAVVPTMIDGAFECWPRHKKMFSLWKRVEVHYGPCINADDVKKMSDRELAQRVTEILREMQTECRKRQGRDVFDYS